MNILISDSKGTSYANGLYHFELICDETFPAKPPKMQLLTGKGNVRFNPNLYENGYVCLTWFILPDFFKGSIQESRLAKISKINFNIFKLIFITCTIRKKFSIKIIFKLFAASDFF
jgi:ubiquitin-protein ligase